MPELPEGWVWAGAEELETVYAVPGAFDAFKPAVLERLRRDIAGQPGGFLQLIAQTEAAVGQSLVWESYKRPKPCENPDLLPYYTWKRDVCCIRTEPIAEDTFGPALETRVAAFLESLIPLYDFCNLYKV